MINTENSEYKIDIQWRKINKPKSWQFERINKIHKHLTKLIYKNASKEGEIMVCSVIILY